MTNLAPSPLLDKAAILRLSVLAVTLLVAVWALDRLGLRDMLATGWMDARVRGKGWEGVSLFVAVAALGTAIGLPRQIPAFLAGYAFGPGWGVVLALTPCVISAAVIHQYAHHMGRDWLTGRFPGHMSRMEDFLSGNTFEVVLALRLAPFTNNLATNLAAGVTGAALMPFAAASALGYLPQTAAFVLIGCGTLIDPLVNGLLFVALLAVSGMLGMILWRRARRSSEIADRDPA